MPLFTKVTSVCSLLPHTSLFIRPNPLSPTPPRFFRTPYLPSVPLFSCDPLSYPLLFPSFRPLSLSCAVCVHDLSRVIRAFTGGRGRDSYRIYKVLSAWRVTPTASHYIVNKSACICYSVTYQSLSNC